MKVFEERGVRPESILLVKRKGRIRIQLPEESSYFEFFRVKSVSIDETNHTWENFEHYETVSDGVVRTVANWEEVIAEVRKWLADSSQAAPG